MALKHVVGLDHILIAVRNLDNAASAWKALGFTVSPRGTHSPHLGSGNHTIVFGEDYIELLGILNETPHNRPTIAFLKEREGIARTAFTTDDAAGLATELKARGIVAEEPLAFGRPVDLPDGGKGEARFNVCTWPASEAPAGLRIFACQHLTRDMVWIPALQRHANGARRLARVEVLAADPKATAEHLARLIDQPVSPITDGFRVPTGGNRAAFEFYDAAAFAGRYPEAVRAGAPAQGAVALAIVTDDLAAARAQPGVVTHGDAASVPAVKATGVILTFVKA